MKKINVAILFGGKSAEHEVSLQSAKNILEAIDKEKYDITLIGIDKTGKWYSYDSRYLLQRDNVPKQITSTSPENHVVLVPGEGQRLLFSAGTNSDRSIDVVFPVLHGTNGEDGTVQGLLQLAGIPYVGAGVLGSAVGMDKDVAKRLLRDAGIAVAKFRIYHYWEQENIKFADVVSELGLPLFVKPANAGSSVGVSKVKNEQEFTDAIEKAFRFDNKILLEEAINGREIECAVLGNDNPRASAIGEIIAQQEFYSYEAKYIDENGAILEIPANISDEISQKIQEAAVKTFKVLGCEGMARVDFFLAKDHRIIVNEINTIPGFTKISMYPKLWEISGLSYSELIHSLIQLALERHERAQRFQTSY